MDRNLIFDYSVRFDYKLLVSNHKDGIKSKIHSFSLTLALTKQSERTSKREMPQAICPEVGSINQPTL